MKLSFILMATMMSSATFAADDQPRNETRSRLIGEHVIGVSPCSATKVKTQEFQEPIRKQDGTYSQTKDGQIRTRTMTKVTASTRIEMTKCQVQESYMVQVTGSFWNSKSSEIQGSAKQFSTLDNQQLTVTNSQDFDVKKLSQAAGDDSIFTDGGTMPILLSLVEGLKAQVREECEGNLAQIKATLVPQTQTDCR